MYGYNTLTTCGGINLTLSWKRQENRGTRCEIDHTPKKDISAAEWWRGRQDRVSFGH